MTDKSRIAFDERINQIYASHSAQGRLRSGSTIIAALRAMEESGEAILASSIDQVGSVAKDVEAFAMLHTNLESFISYLELKLDDVLRVSGAAKDGVVMSGASREARLKFATVRSNLTRQIEIHRFTFTQPFQSGASGKGNPPSPTETTAPAKNLGGKPVAKHWDSMWAAMAVKLYVGDLQPSSQADVERAMKDWFAERNLEIGDTAVRDRARALWTEYQAAQ
ncbi:hypothetical protein [Sphingobium baderi]|uniref:hypothetical protein n=1 Tax=Sphingobium baderi TaxID=1332080 RepID=UPI002B415563|nr:hypothetical protein [Sphingobium baderi]WRD76018.1 hypothetical protein QQ987_14755 [Sphingobium baderi]